MVVFCCTFRSVAFVNEHFVNKSQARAAVSYLAVLQMLEKGLINHNLNPVRTKERLVVSTSVESMRASTISWLRFVVFPSAFWRPLRLLLLHAHPVMSR